MLLSYVHLKYKVHKTTRFSCFVFQALTQPINPFAVLRVKGSPLAICLDAGVGADSSGRLISEFKLHWKTIAVHLCEFSHEACLLDSN